MAITPQQAKELMEKERSRVEELERMIDRTIRKKFRRGYITIDMPRNLNPRITDELVRRYREHWEHVRYEGANQRNEGHYFQVGDGGILPN